MRDAETTLLVIEDRGKLADLNVKGRKERPSWVLKMAALKRKTLAVCRRCHVAIHAGKPTRKPTASVK